jgi:hypothetical protein
MARNQRRRVIREAVDFEQEREAALLAQLEETAAELDGSRLDEEVFARMDSGDADIVRAVLQGPTPEEEILENDLEGDWLASETDPGPESDLLLAEISRLEEEVARSRRRREAFERYVEELDR